MHILTHLFIHISRKRCRGSDISDRNRINLKKNKKKVIDESNASRVISWEMAQHVNDIDEKKITNFTLTRKTVC